MYTHIDRGAIMCSFWQLRLSQPPPRTAQSLEDTTYVEGAMCSAPNYTSLQVVFL